MGTQGGGSSGGTGKGASTGAGAGRYAPSPTGELHLGNLRTAVLAWLFARSSGRALLLRIEDLDTGRVRPGYAVQQVADLAALGIGFDAEPVWQSRRGEAYAAALERLRPATFPCFCTRRDIAEAASAPHGSPARYPGTCRYLTSAERAARSTVRTPAWRLRAEGAISTVLDAIHGEVGGPVDDIVLRRSDGQASYHLASVLDDGTSGVDQVVRGDDLLDAAVSQAYLAELLGLRVPTYAHVPLAVNATGARLAKRDGAVTLADLAALGVSAGEVLTRIAVSLHLAAPGEPVTLPLLLDRFDPGALPREPWVVGD